MTQPFQPQTVNTIKTSWTYKPNSGSREWPLWGGGVIQLVAICKLPITRHLNPTHWTFNVSINKATFQILTKSFSKSPSLHRLPVWGPKPPSSFQIVFPPHCSSILTVEALRLPYRCQWEKGRLAASGNVGMTAASVYHVGYNSTPWEAARACILSDPGSNTAGQN